MRAVAIAIALAGVVAAGETAVVIEARDGPAVEGVLIKPQPLTIETRYGEVGIPVDDLLSIQPGEGVALTHAGAVRGRLDWTEIVVRTTSGEARLPIKDVVRVTWRRERSPPRAEHFFHLAGGTTLCGTAGPEEFEFATSYGMLRVPLAKVRLLVPEEGGYQLRVAGTTLRGDLRVKCWKVKTAYGVLDVPAGDLVRLADRPIPIEGDRLDGGYVVRAVRTRGASIYALAVRDRKMTFADATDVAKKLGGHLATVADEAENKCLCDLCGGLTAHAWIGLTDAGHEGDWRWVTNERVGYTNWNDGEPNNMGRRENHCDFLVESGGIWNDVFADADVPACLVEIDALVP